MFARRANPFIVGVAYAVAYGIVARLVANYDAGAGGFFVMTIGVLFVVPFVLGYLTVRPVEEPTETYRLTAPWISSLLSIAVSVLVGWEGSICVIMGAPVILFMSSLGGIAGASAAARKRAVLPALLVLPYLLAPIEARRTPPQRFVESVAEIDIDAPPSAVWPLVASVDSIRPEETHPAFFTRIGFPRPISATLSAPGVGGIRRARFEHGVTFTETVTSWEPDSLLSFTIRPNTDSIPPTTLDPHVTIGGRFFDVLTGTYELHALGDSRTRLVLRSRHRVSTPFNLYAEWWADRIMRSVQENILAVHRLRAERVKAAASQS
jgi:hypothetical protein